jgi:hypothetical protein
MDSKEPHVPTLTRLMALMSVVGWMAGCVAPPPGKSTTATTETFLKYAGPPIDSFTYLGHYDSFRTLGGNDVAIWTTINDVYLIRVRSPCVELPFANVVELTSTAHTVSRTYDYVIVDHDHCHIDTIRHVDYGAMKRAHLAGP